MTQSITDAAQAYLDADLSVIPVGKDKKATIKWTQFQREPLDPTEAPRVFSNAWGLAVICGEVSDGIEIIDFDAHDKDIDLIFKQFCDDERVAHLLAKHELFIERSPSGGYHLAYTYETSENRDGNLKLANWVSGDSMIETRGEGGYTIVYPSPKYTVISGSMESLPRLLEEERDYLIAFARTFTKAETKDPSSDEDPDRVGDAGTDPVSLFNWNKTAHAKHILKDEGWVLLRTDKDLEYWQRPGKDPKQDSHSATWGYKTGALYVFSSSVEPFQPMCYYTPFQILVLLRFGGNYRAATEWIITKYMSEDVPYIRVGTNFFKRIVKVDRFGIERIEIKVWNKEAVTDDHGKKYISRIPRFDDFTTAPDNITYRPVINNCYNLYREFMHSPVNGSWRWTKVLLQHIFGDQYELGIRYLQILYLHPERLMPILVLVSRIRQTGKTTFLNWLNMVFGDNMANISPDDLINGFNAAYSAANIIAVEETMLEKKVTVEKLKALATSKFITVNQKFVSQYRTPFYGKIILTSNNEDKFAQIDQEEIRFFVRKIPTPPTENHNIETDMIAEIPAFLHYLTTLPAVDFSLDRTGFLPEELSNESLAVVKKESRTETCKVIQMHVEGLFLNELASDNEFLADASDIHSKYFHGDRQNTIYWIRRVLKDEMNLENAGMQWYSPFKSDQGKTARPFKFIRSEFTDAPSTEIPF